MGMELLCSVVYTEEVLHVRTTTIIFIHRRHTAHGPHSYYMHVQSRELWPDVCRNYFMDRKGFKIAGQSPHILPIGAG